MSLTSLTRVKNQLGIPAGVTAHDAILNNLITEANDAILDMIGLPAGLTSATYNEVYDVESEHSDRLRLRRYPILSVGALTVLDTAWTVTGAWKDRDIYIEDADAGWIRTLPANKFFGQGKQTVEITYSAGYDAVPGVLQKAASDLVVYAFNVGGKIGLQGERIGSYSYTLATSSIRESNAWPAAVWIGLSGFRRIVPQRAGVVAL